jgi:hypothetical protein
LKYKSFIYEQQIELNKDKYIKIEFPAEFEIVFNIIDSRGIGNTNKDILLIRNDKELKIENSNSNISISVPPGRYSVKTYDNGNLIGSRNIDVFSNSKFEIITLSMPYFIIIFFVMLSFIILLSLYLYVKKNLYSFITFLSITLIIFSIFFPWWTLNGFTEEIDTTTNMFIFPTELITTYATNDLIAGERAYLPDLFLFAINVIIIISIVSSILILLNFFIKNKIGNKYILIIKILSLILLFSSIIIFYIGMNTLLESGVGSFVSEGNLNIRIVGEETMFSINCNWGPSYGFYLYLLSIIILIIPEFCKLKYIKKVLKKIF